MSDTPTPRTDAATYQVWGIENVNSGFARTLETELTAANARVAELAESNAVLQSQVDNADINLEQVRMTQKGLWRSKLESAEARIAELERQRAGWEAACKDQVRRKKECRESFARQLSETQAQLAASSERMSQLCALLDIECAEATPEDRIRELRAQLASALEDGERLDWLEKIAADEAGNVIKISRFTNGFTHLVLGHDPLAITLNGLRSAIDSARGVLTSPPASGEAEPGPESTEMISFLEEIIDHIGSIPERKLLALDSDPHPPSVFACLKERAQELLDSIHLPMPPTQDGKEQGK